MPDSKRQLLAIMFTDIVGYTAMMNDDEASTVDILKLNLEIHTLIAQECNGKVRKEIGDGLMLSFKSVSDAIQAAKEILKETRKYGYQLRIGIHEGEVIIKKGDLFGDNVNIASRIESQCKPDCIYISESARANLRNKKHINLITVGKRELKNIKDPMDLYEVSFENSNNASRTGPFKGYAGPANFGSAKPYLIVLVFLVLAAILYVSVFQKGALLKETSSVKNIQIEKSIAVLPFESSTDREDYAFMGESFADDIIVKLCRLKGCKVISPRSSFSEKNKGRSIYDVAKDLKVNYVLEGSFNIFNNDIRINYKLVNIKNAEVAVADNYTGGLDQLFQLQDKVSENIVNALDETLIHSFRTGKSSTGFNKKRYLEFHKGKKLLREPYLSKEILLEARKHFLNAIEIDPEFFEGHIEICESFNLEVNMGYRSFISVKDSFNYFLEKATMLNPISDQVYLMEARGNLAKWNLQEGKDALIKSLELNENNPGAYFTFGVYSGITGNMDEFIVNMSKAIELDPLDRFYTMIRDFYLAVLGEYELAINNEREILLRDPEDVQVPWIIGTSYAMMGNFDKAFSELEKRKVGKTTNFINGYVYGKIGMHKEANIVLNNLLERSKKGYVPPSQIAIVYLGLDDNENALKQLKKAIEIRDGFFGILTRMSFFDPIRDQFSDLNYPTF